MVRPAAKRGHGPLTLWSDPHAQGWGVGKKGACDRLPRTPATWRTAPLAGEGRGGVVKAARCPNLAPKLVDSGGVCALYLYLRDNSGVSIPAQGQ